MGRYSFAFLYEPEQQVLGSDVVVAELAGLFNRKFQNSLGLGIKGNFAHRHGCRSLLHKFLDLEPERFEVHPQIRQRGRGYSLALFHQTQQQMFRAYVVMIKSHGLFARKLNHFAHAFSKPVKHATSPLSVFE